MFSDGPAKYFTVDKLSGTIKTRECLSRDKNQYLLSVTAKDQVNNKNTTCKVTELTMSERVNDR